MVKRVTIATVIGLLAIASGPAFATEKLTIGNAQVVVRTVTGELDSDVRKIKLLDDIYHNELIETGESSATELTFLDDTKLALGPNSSLTLDRFVYNPEPDKASFVATATAGVFRFVSGKLPKKSYTIHTPTATIGIRGTVFSIVVIPSSSDADGSGPIVNVTIEHGAADIISCEGKEVSLDRPGQSTTVTMKPDGTCSAPSVPGEQPAEFASILGGYVSDSR